MARSTGGGGGGANAQQSAEELADLFGLEMDKLRNQYEQVERGRRQETDNQTDEARERLRELARRQQQENERLRARMDEMAEQRRVQDEVGGLTGQPAADAERIQRLDQRKQDMAGQVEGLENDIDRLSRESVRDQRDASRKLAEASEGIRDAKLREKIMYSRGVIRGCSPEYARNFEDQIGSDIEALRRRLAEAGDAGGESREQRMARGLERAGDLVNGLESLRERLRGQQAGRAQASRGERGCGSWTVS